MSITVDYYFNWSGTLDELSTEVRTWIGADLQPYEGDPGVLYCRLLGMEFTLGEHHLTNDADLNFEDFRFEIGIRTPWPDADFRPIQLFTMASLVYALYRRLAITDGILVFDVQVLLARYEQRSLSAGERGLYDTVSGEFVSFPHHPISLFSKSRLTPKF